MLIISSAPGDEQEQYGSAKERGDGARLQDNGIKKVACDQISAHEKNRPDPDAHGQEEAVVGTEHEPYKVRHNESDERDHPRDRDACGGDECRDREEHLPDPLDASTARDRVLITEKEQIELACCRKEEDEADQDGDDREADVAPVA